jgi:uncharacterized membrane protein YbhN (UPF0104 family)
MLRYVRRVTTFLHEKQILHKIGVALSLTIIAIACYVLYHLLRNLDLHEVAEAVRNTPKRRIGVSALFVAAGYFTLTFYDLFALRAIGRADIPYRIAALGGFTSYSVGHNVGASVFTGGAVRYRVYSPWGVSGIDIAKVCFIAGLTFWLGNAAVLGLGITYRPEAASAIDQLPVWLNRGFGVGMLLGLVGYLAWVWAAPRRMGEGQWIVELPGGPLTLLQIAIGIVDLACCALAMYMLVPDAPHIGFVSVAVIFVSATLLGFASHSPGGLGVFDAAMLVGLWQMDREGLLAGLLLFRLLYYLAPFMLCLCVLAIRELTIGAQARRRAADTPVMVPSASDFIAAELDTVSIKPPIAKETCRRA